MIVKNLVVDFFKRVWYNAWVRWEKPVLHRGKIARDREVKGVRELVREDLEVLRPTRPAQAVANMRDAHHWVAKYIAAGMTMAEVAEASGYSLNRIWQLKQVPAFQNLVLDYRKLNDEGYKDVIVDYLSLKTKNKLKAERQLSEHLDKSDEEGELLPVRSLISISREQDRNTNIQVNVGDFATQLDGAIKRSSKFLEPPKTEVSFKRKFA
jgi:hypothetical protein